MNKAMLTYLENLYLQDVIGSPEVEFSRFLKELDPGISNEVMLAGAACVNAQLNGHVCLDLEKMNGRYLFNEPRSNLRITEDLIGDWTKELKKSVLVGKKGDLEPMILQDHRLYLQKYLEYEEELVAWVKKKAEIIHDPTDKDREVLRSYVNKNSSEEINWQDVAVYLSFLKDLVIISGGPGTGKTYTVLKILEALTKSRTYEKERIALAAPTGKAAQRLAESIKAGKEEAGVEKGKLEKVPEQAMTVHKLLGADFRGGGFKFNKKRKLPYDIIVIDEASMLDINMWVQLIRAMPAQAKLIVLGDKDQLASVEAGSILGDLCGGENSFSAVISGRLSNDLGWEVPQNNEISMVNDCLLFLTHSYRFSEKSGIQQLSEAINESNAERAIELLESEEFPDLNRLDLSSESIDYVISKYVLEHYQNYMQETSLSRLSMINRKKILCALRQGLYGVENINKLAEERIKKDNNYPASLEWFVGRQVLASKNNPVLKIRNGETGIYMEEEAGEYVYFGGEENKKIQKSRLKDYEAGFSVTIHKSQGSEFDDVAILLPNQENPILSKELLYTSVTRARQSLLVIGNKEILKQSVKTNIYRNSGLKQKLWG